MINFCPPAKKAYRTVEEFENKFAEKVGVKHAVAVNSGFSALFVALWVAGVRAGDEVIVPDFTMIATAHAVRMCGATPVFSEVKICGNIDVEDAESRITDRTKAIIPVHIYGKLADMEAVRELGKRHDVWVIEDSAEAHGAVGAGSSGDMGCFSFYSNKIISTGEGGAITTNDDALAEELKKVRSYYFEDSYLHKGMGWGFRMNQYGAEEGIRNLAKWDELIQRRSEIARFYNDNLKNVILPDQEVGRVYWMYGIRTNQKLNLKSWLLEKGIETRDMFYPMHLQPMYKNDDPALVNAEILFRTGLLLPIMPSLDEGELQIIADAVNSFIS